MYYFYYFQDTQTKLYYGGITNNVLNRQALHQTHLKQNKKSDKKPWHLFQDKIQLIVLWAFNTKKEACVYEKQWIINNYLNPLCLNCSVSNSEYYANTLNHKQLSETNGGCKAKVIYALEVNNGTFPYTFKSNYKAASYTGVNPKYIPSACKNAKPFNSESKRWLFSDVSIDDLKAKFNNLTQTEIKGINNYAKGLILINEKTNDQSCVYYSINELYESYKLTKSNLCAVLKGKRRTINNFRVAFCI